MSELKLAAEFEPKTRNDWLALVEAALRGADFEDTLVARTRDGIRIDPLYTPGDEAFDQSSLTPGTQPFTRGWSAGKTDPAWEIDQLHVDRAPETANKAILSDLEGGATSITLRLAAPGQSGLDPTSNALNAALKGVHLDMIALSFDAGLNIGKLPEMLAGLAKGRGRENGNMRISLGADPLGALARLGALDVDMENAYRQIEELTTARDGGLPIQRILLADGRPYHNAGAGAAQELACVMATIVAYVRARDDAGAHPGQTIPELSVSLAADTDLFETTAKFRAARRLVWQIADACGCAEAAARVELSAQTSERMMTRRDPWVNMLRTTAACAAAAMGGAQAITVLPYTWAIGAPDSFARRMARNCQMVLREEASFGAVLDPAGGSHYVDYLTDELSEKAWHLFQDIEKDGGMFKALQSGKIQNMIRATHEARANDIAMARQELTGISSFPQLNEKPVSAEPHILPPPLDDVAITVEPLHLRRLSAPFEKLRDASDAYRARTGHPPTVFLANLGTVQDFNMRANWAANFFGAGGMATTENQAYEDYDTLIAAFEKSGASLACICSSDAIYGNEAEEAAKRLKSAKADYVYLAGRAGENRDAYRSAGIDAFIHAGVNILETLSDAHDRLGVS